MTETTAELPTDAPESGESFGTWLRQQREMREIHLNEIADRTKISQRYLQAMEEDNFDLLPGPIFVKGFLREYAKYVGLNPDEVVNFYLSTQVSPEETQNGQTAEERPSDWGWGRGLLLALLAILALAALTFALFSYLGREGRGGETGPASDPAAASRRDASPEGRSRSSTPPANRAQDGVAESSGGASDEGLGDDPEAAGRTDGTAAATSATTSTAPLVVTLDFSEDCWVEIVVDGGAQRVDQRFVQGESLTLEAQERVDFLTLGNAGGVSLRVNGRPWPLAARSQEVLRDLRIDVGAAQRLTRGEDVR